MDSPVNAFGIFALERDPAGKPLDFAADGYSGGMGCFFRQGDRYVQVIASDQKPGTLALAQKVSEHLAREMPANDAGLEARRRLSAAGMLPESVTYIQENAHGQGFLKEVFQADYQFEGKTITFFLLVTNAQVRRQGLGRVPGIQRALRRESRRSARQLWSKSFSGAELRKMEDHLPARWLNRGGRRCPRSRPGPRVPGEGPGRKHQGTSGGLCPATPRTI